jgi:GTP diphosphokinase / guanosine-3',5'-bis(diphosphate) 3'-diphosphatase
MIYTRDYAYLEERVAPHLTQEELGQVRRAYEVAEKAHAYQVRDEGTPYIVHPVRVAVSLVDELQLFSPKLVCSALLHDVIEDSPTTRRQITDWFGAEIAEVVWLLTKFDDTSLVDYLTAIEEAHETGAPIVKLCDRLDNLRFLSHSHKLEKKYRYIRTTENHYLPMAARTNDYLYQALSSALAEVKTSLNA